MPQRKARPRAGVGNGRDEVDHVEVTESAGDVWHARLAHRLRHARDFRDRLDDARFIVDHHHRHEGGRRAFADHLFKSGDIDDAVARHRDELDIGKDIAHGRMLDRGNEDALAFELPQHRVVGFRRAAGEHDLIGMRAGERRDLLARGRRSVPGGQPLYIGHRPMLLRGLTARENLEYFAALYHVPAAETAARIAEAQIERARGVIP